MNNRLSKLREKLIEQGLDGALILKPENRRYLSGFTGTSAVLLITQSEALLFTDFRYLEQAAVQAPDYQIVKHGQVVWDTVAAYLTNVRRLGFEQEFVSYAQVETFRQTFSATELIPVSGLVEGLRSIKEGQELADIQHAVDLADAAFAHILEYIKPGVTEKQIALELEFHMRRNGASGASFDFIVASGTRSSMPHGVATDRVVGKGDLITMDFGCVYNGYCSDITRTVVIGQPSEKQREIYQIVLDAQLAGIKALRPGVTGQAVDKVARDLIAAHGYGDNFGHGLGHAVGLEIHEEPRLSLAGNTILQPGMTETIEPGIYLPEWGGVRIEDVAVLTESGNKVLTKAPKELIIL